MAVKVRQLSLTGEGGSKGMPDAAELAALRAWYEGLPAHDAVKRYLSHARADRQSARGMIGSIRRRLRAFARGRHREDLATLFAHPDSERRQHARAVKRAIELLPCLPLPAPLIGDAIDRWLEPRAVVALKAHGIKTLAALTLRIPRRRRWWATIPGLGARGARRIEGFFAEHPELTERARALIATGSDETLVPWERLTVPEVFDGSQGRFRAPRATCTLAANNDYEAVQAWLEIHESPATQRAYRKESERLILWAIVERGRALSSLTTEDAVAYRSFLRNPTPRARWVGPSAPRSSTEWRPFVGALSPRSIAYALSVLGAMYRWLVQQHYVLANPFAGIKIRAAARVASLPVARSFTDGEWAMVQAVAEGLEWSYGWQPASAQRLRFVIEFCYATGLRAGELVGATLGLVEIGEGNGDRWLNVVGKGGKCGRVALPPLARAALDRYLAQRGLPTTPTRWDPSVPLVGALGEDTGSGISTGRLRAVLKRFFNLVADLVAERNPSTAQKLRRASPHWMRHTHASHALSGGAELISVRDNLRHASLSTTSIYLHAEDSKRAQQLGKVFRVR